MPYVILTLKGAGASDRLIEIALDNTSLPEQVKKTAKTISDGIPTGYERIPTYQPQPSYP